jgi:hypothetical protein
MLFITETLVIASKSKPGRTISPFSSLFEVSERSPRILGYVFRISTRRSKGRTEIYSFCHISRHGIWHLLRGGDVECCRDRDLDQSEELRIFYIDRAGTGRILSRVGCDLVQAIY